MLPMPCPSSSFVLWIRLRPKAIHAGINAGS
jgi:hypothetical protein